MTDPTSRPLTGQTALVTGSAVRVGRALVLALAEAGANVAVHYRSSGESAERTADDARSFGVEAKTFTADLSRAEEVEALAEAVQTTFGPAHILINNASVFARTDLDATTVEDLRLNQAIHVEAPLVLSRWLARSLPADQRGSIVNMLDHRAENPDPKFVPYSLSKGGLAGLTHLLAQELAPAVSVNGVSLGAILPPPELDEDAGRAHLDKVGAACPLGRVGSVVDVVAACMFLVCDAPYTTGTTIPVDGGRFLQ